MWIICEWEEAAGQGRGKSLESEDPGLGPALLPDYLQDVDLWFIRLWTRLPSSPMTGWRR